MVAMVGLGCDAVWCVVACVEECGEGVCGSLILSIRFAASPLYLSPPHSPSLYCSSPLNSVVVSLAHTSYGHPIRIRFDSKSRLHFPLFARPIAPPVRCVFFTQATQDCL